LSAERIPLSETVVKKLRDQGKDVISVADPEIAAKGGTTTLVRQVFGATAESEARLTMEGSHPRGGDLAPPVGQRLLVGE